MSNDEHGLFCGSIFLMESYTTGWHTTVPYGMCRPTLTPVENFSVIRHLLVGLIIYA